jgi:hypothetical protein
VSTIAAALAAGMNPNRLACAAHEVGHALAFHHAGIPVRAMHIRPIRDGGWSGGCDPAVRQIPIDQVPGWQVGLMAGEAAVYRFLRRHARNRHSQARDLAEHGARHDLTEFRRTRGRGGLPLAEARAQAAALVERHSARIDQLTIRLASSQRLSGSVL